MTFGLVTSWIRTSASQIRGERIFPGGRGKSNIRPMTVEELKTIRDRLNNIMAENNATGQRNYT